MEKTNLAQITSWIQEEQAVSSAPNDKRPLVLVILTSSSVLLSYCSAREKYSLRSSSPSSFHENFAQSFSRNSLENAYPLSHTLLRFIPSPYPHPLRYLQYGDMSLVDVNKGNKLSSSPSSGWLEEFCAILSRNFSVPDRDLGKICVITYGWTLTLVLCQIFPWIAYCQDWIINELRTFMLSKMGF